MIKIKKGGRKRLEEKAASKSQQALFGMALSVKTGEKKLEDFGAGLQEKLKKIIDSMTEKQIRDYAETKTKNLPDKIEEFKKHNRMPYVKDLFEGLKRPALTNQDIDDKSVDIFKKFQITYKPEYVDELKSLRDYIEKNLPSEKFTTDDISPKIYDSMTDDDIFNFVSLANWWLLGYELPSHMNETEVLIDEADLRKIAESVKEDDLVTFMQGDIHRYGKVLSINTSKQTANVEYEHSGEETTDDIPLGKLSVIQKIPENKTFKRMPHLKDLYEFSAVPTKVISEADLRKIAEYINSLGYIVSIPNSANTIYTTTLIGPVAETLIKDFIDNMGLKVIINNGQMSSTISIYEEGEATLDSTVGRGEFSAGNNPADASDTTKGSGEKFGDVKKKKVGEEEIFTVQDLEKYYYDNEDDIVDNMNTYGWDVDSLSGLGNYVDLANVLGIDSRKVKDVELDVYVATLIELLKMR